MDVTPPPGTLATATKVKWDTLDPPLSDLTLRVLKEKLGYEYLTPVQAATLPEFLRFKDVAVEVWYLNLWWLSRVDFGIRLLQVLEKPLPLSFLFLRNYWNERTNWSKMKLVLLLLPLLENWHSKFIKSYCLLLKKWPNLLCPFFY